METQNQTPNNKTEHKQLGKKEVWAIIGVIAIFIYIIFIADNFNSSSSPTPTSQPEVKTVAEIPKNEQKEVEAKLPKINFTGEVKPSIAKIGEKVVIRVDIENLSDTETINEVRLLFSDDNFLNQGLVITNIMNGGKQDGRSFLWKDNDLMNIPPKQKRSFNIIANANKAGNYKSIISIKKGSQIYSDPEGNEELVAKLVVTP